MKSPIKLFGIGCTFQAIIFIFFIITMVYIIKKCNKSVEETGKGVVEQFGGGIRKIQNNFNKGYNNIDTLFIDSIK